MKAFRKLLCFLLVFAMVLPVCMAEELTLGDMFTEGEDGFVEMDDGSDINSYVTLQRGDMDQEGATAYIVVLQNRLAYLGFLNGVPDGVYGEGTETAVAEFQRLNGLMSTGIADPTTQAKIFADTATLVTPAPDAIMGSDALRVQTMLSQWGFLTGSIDGKLGEQSKKAIRAFKAYVSKNGLIVMPTAAPTPAPTPTPEPDPDAMPMVDDEPIDTPEPQVQQAQSIEYSEFNSDIDDLLLQFVDGKIKFPVYRAPVQNGDNSEEVKRVQTRLKQLNYLYPDPDGAFGMNTARALMYFQRKHGLQETGVADQATQEALFSASAQKAEEWVFPYKIAVDISDQRVYVAKWDGQAYTIKANIFICSTGKDKTPTPVGTYQGYGGLSGEWYYFKNFNCYAKWAWGIVGGILFHSVTYSASKKLNSGSVYALGHKASHGCVRLKVEDAKWIYEHCPAGTTVVIRK